MNTLVYVAPIALASAVGAGACATHGADIPSEAPPSEAVQAAVPDTDCNVGAASAADVFYSAFTGLDGNGTFYFANGDTLSVLNSDSIGPITGNQKGEHFDWSATFPISVVIAYGGVGGQMQDKVVYTYDPAALHGEGLHTPEDPDNPGTLLPFAALRFCFREDPDILNDAGTDNTDPDAGADTGADAQQDAAPPSAGYTW